MEVCFSGAMDAPYSDGLLGCLFAHGSTGEWTVLAVGVIALIGGYGLARGGAFDLSDH